MNLTLIPINYDQNVLYFLLMLHDCKLKEGNPKSVWDTFVIMKYVKINCANVQTVLPISQN